jgi:comEA protein
MNCEYTHGGLGRARPLPGSTADVEIAAGISPRPFTKEDRMLRLLTLLAAIAFFAAHPAAQAAQKAAATRTEAKPAAASINLNTATAAELEKLPGIGQKVAARIVEYRQKHGPFKKVEELMNVQGIGEKSFLQFRNQLTVGQ